MPCSSSPRKARASALESTLGHTLLTAVASRSLKADLYCVNTISMSVASRAGTGVAAVAPPASGTARALNGAGGGRMGGAGGNAAADVLTASPAFADTGAAASAGSSFNSAGAGVVGVLVFSADVGTAVVSLVSALMPPVRRSGRERDGVLGGRATAAGAGVAIGPRLSATGSDGTRGSGWAGSGWVAGSGSVVGSSVDGAPGVDVARRVGIGSCSAALAADGRAASRPPCGGAATGADVRQIRMPDVVNPRHPQIPATIASRRVVKSGACCGMVRTTAGRSGGTATPFGPVEKTIAR